MLDNINPYLYTNDDEDLKIWDRSALLQIKTFSKAKLVSLSADGKFLVCERSIIDIATLRDITPYALQENYIGSIVDYQADQHRVLQLYYDTLRYVDLKTLKTKNLVSYRTYEKDGLGKVDLVTMDDSLGLVAAGIDYGYGFCTYWNIVVHHVTDGKEITVLDGTEEQGQCLRQILFAPRHNIIISHDGSKLIFWGVKRGKRLKEHVLEDELGKGLITCTSLTENGNFLLVGYHDGRIQKWDISKLTVIQDHQLGDGINYHPISALESLGGDAVVLASGNSLMIQDLSQNLEFASVGTSQSIEPISQLIIDVRNDALYSLRDDELTRWNFRSLLNFKQANFGKDTPKSSM